MSNSDFSRATIANNPAWAQLLGLCPLLAVSSTVANATGLALASAFVVIGANTSISLLRRIIPEEARLPCFVLIIATFTTLTVMVLEAYAFDLYGRIALFVLPWPYCHDRVTVAVLFWSYHPGHIAMDVSSETDHLGRTGQRLDWLS